VFSPPQAAFTFVFSPPQAAFTLNSWRWASDSRSAVRRRLASSLAAPAARRMVAAQKECGGAAWNLASWSPSRRTAHPSRRARSASRRRLAGWLGVCPRSRRRGLARWPPMIAGTQSSACLEVLAR
jgi:hypothetical protein